MLRSNLTRALGAVCAALFAFLFALSSTSALAADTGAQSQPLKWNGWWELGGYYGTDDSSRGEVTLFTPVVQGEASLVFLDFRGKFFEESVEEGNFAIGYREMLSGWNVGVWSGFDIRSTETGNTFNQVSGGFEALAAAWDVRVNGYAPLSDPVSTPSLAEVFITGNQILMTGGQEVPLYGIDGEIGGRVLGNESTFGELWLFGGGFWFDDEDALEEVAGPKARVEYRLNDVFAALPGSRLTIESEYSNDQVRDDKWEIGARLRIPFWTPHHDRSTRSYASLSGQERRMVEGLERDTDIVTGPSKTENVLDDATDVAFNSVSQVNSAAGLAGAVNPNKLVVIKNPGADIDVSGTGGQVLPNNITVQGGGSTINVRGANSGTVVPFAAPGARPTVTNTANSEIFRSANRSHFAGLDLTGAGAGSGSTFNHGISDRSMADQTAGTVLPDQLVVLSDLNISDIGGSGARFGGASHFSLLAKGITINDAGRSGFDFNGAGGLVGAPNINLNTKFSGIHISDVGEDGFEFNNAVSLFSVANVNISVDDAVIERTDDDGIDLSGAIDQFAGGGSANAKVKFKNLYIDSAGDSAVDAGGSFDNFENGSTANFDLTLKNVMIKNTLGNDALSFNGSFDEFENGSTAKFNIVFDGIRIEDTISGDAIGSPDVDEFDNSTANVKLVYKDIEILNSENQGIDLTGDFDEFDGGTLNAEILFKNVSVENSGDEGMDMGYPDDFPGGTANVRTTMRNIRIKNSGTDGTGAGIDFAGSSDEFVGGTANVVVDMKDVWVEDSADQGIDFGFSFDEFAGGTADFLVNLEDVTVLNSGTAGNVGEGAGIDFANSFDEFPGGQLTSSVNFRNVRVDTTFEQGIELENVGDATAGTRTFTFNGITLTDIGTHGIDFENTTGLSATFSDVTANGTLGGTVLRASPQAALPAPELNGAITNQTASGNCQGTWDGTIIFSNGVVTPITDGVGC